MTQTYPISRAFRLAGPITPDYEDAVAAAMRADAERWRRGALPPAHISAAATREVDRLHSLPLTADQKAVLALAAMGPFVRSHEVADKLGGMPRPRQTDITMRLCTRGLVTITPPPPGKRALGSTISITDAGLAALRGAT